MVGFEADGHILVSTYRWIACGKNTKQMIIYDNGFPVDGENYNLANAFTGHLRVRMKLDVRLY